MVEKKINFGIDDGITFFAHEVSVNFNPTQFVLDFKSISPRVDPRSNEGAVISIKHNVVLMDVYHLKKFTEFLKKRIDDYEKEFGNIEKPNAIKIIEKKRQKEMKDKKTDSVEIPTYFG
ncbi:MAG: DUF3467 domain-containing protein [Nanoarchaeota archaeon]